MHKKVIYLIIGLVSAGILWQCTSPESKGENTDSASPPKQYTISQFMNTVRLSGSSFSPDESKILFTSNQSGIFNAYEIALTGGTPKAQTESKTNSIFAISYFPTDERILFSSDKGGNEITNIYKKDLDGKITNLTPDTTAKSEFVGWSADKKSFFYVTNKRNPQFFDLYEMDITNLQSKLIYKNEQGLDVGAISDDKRYLALYKSITTSNTDIYLYDAQTKKTSLITKHTGDVANSPQTFSPDNKKLYYTTDEGSEFAYLKSYDLISGKAQKEAEEPWDISYMYFSKKGKYKVIGINNDAKTQIKIYTAADNQLVKLPSLPAGEITGVTISDSEKQMAFYVSSSKSPNSLYVYNFETTEYKELINAMNKEIAASDLIEGEVVRFKSYDGLEIPNILYKPKTATPDQKTPVMLMIHGGPGGQTRLNYSPMIQYLVNHGYAILAVNNRGSSGYGKTFFTADDQKHGDADLKDCIASKKYLASLPWVDTTRIGIMGGSYGGYMTLAALTFAPDEFKVGVDIFGVANWLRTLKSIPPWWGSFKDALYKEMGNPATDSVALYNKSPLFHTQRIKKPLLVIQGKNDPRVLKVESDEIVAAVKKNNVPVEYIVFDDEGHGFVKKNNEIKAYEGVLTFLDKHLKK
ncbi:S9 family peptidase [Cytophagaceae bacterium YF14B1]|uniref:S9 family peptidase n=1 Tax=Xanthocytophaga flava TaxID=3048013 RepID=A0AAE3QQK2_9BACT|nr:S9 family peptidase [Xanthocytophaga flavus]MDJ1481588.1 S9 family peptidase [Xanthocytophaga flavus]